MRKLTFALAVGLLVAGTGMVASPRGVAASAPAYVTKVVIVVGQVQGTTQEYINDANTAAAEFQTAATTAGRSVNVVEVYSPNATWSAVQAAAKGANILVYMGHGNGYPNPYVSYEQPLKDNGMGLNAVAGSSSQTTYYYGEAYMAQLQLAPNAIVILNHLCYASGNSEGGLANPTLAVAETRVDGYASGFIRGGASAVIAEGTRDIGYFIDTLFNGHETVDAMWKGDPSFNGNVISYASSRSAGYTSQLDPNVANPPKGGGGPEAYYRSMVSIPSTNTDDVINGQTTPFVSQSGSFYKVSPVVRLVDTRSASIGPLGRLTAGGGYTFQIAGRQVGGVAPVPPNAIAITANLTITNQTAPGWLYLGPTVNSAPASSTINFPKGDNRANGVTVALSPQGTVGAWYGAAGGATIDVIIDVTGYFLAGTSGDGYVAYGPKRVMDTRPNSGIPGPSGVFRAGQHRTIPIAGVAGLPATGIVAVAGNLTVVRPTAKGYVALGPDPTDTPTSSTINFPAGDIRANNVVVPVNADGTLSAVYVTGTAGATVDLVLDITGYFIDGGGALLNTMQPVRILDLRSIPPTPAVLTGPFKANTAKTLQVTGTGVVPTGAVAITANLTVTGQTAAGFAALGPTINASTNFSNLNFPVGDNRANGATVPLLTPGGSLQLIYVAAGSGRTAQLILDVTGYYMPPA
jgi:hypothetical protein